MRILLLSLSLWAVAACTTVHEAAGDKALEDGRKAEAARQYARALTEEALMDFEYERIRDKRLRVLDGELAPELERLKLTKATLSPDEYLLSLLKLRRATRDAGTTVSFDARIEAEILSAASVDRLALTTPPLALKRVDELLVLVEESVRLLAPEKLLDVLVDSIAVTVRSAMPAAERSRSFEQLEGLVAARMRMRKAVLPARLDASVDEAMVRAAGAGFEPSTPSNALEVLKKAAALRLKAVGVHAPPELISHLDSVVEDAARHVRSAARKEAAEGRYFSAIELQQQVAEAFVAGHEVHRELGELRKAAIEQHRQLAAAAPEKSFRRLLHLSLLASLTQNPQDLLLVSKLKAALAPQWETEFDFKPAFSSSCPQTHDALGRMFRRTPAHRSLEVQLHASACRAETLQSRRSETIRYEYQEQYQVSERQQVGTTTEQRPAGKTTYQCSRPSSLGPEYRWQGLCERQNYETVTVPVFADVLVTKVRDRSATLPYTVEVRGGRAQVQASATLVWEDGTRLEASSSKESTTRYEGWSYSLPPRNIGEGLRLHRQELPALDFARESLVSASQMAAHEMRQQLQGSLRAHRARLARAEGAKALASGSESEAEEAFVRSVLHDAKAESEAAAWFVRRYGVSAERLPPVFEAGSRHWVQSSSLELAPPPPWAPAPITIVDGAFDRTVRKLEADADEVATYSFAASVSHGSEVFGVQYRATPFRIRADDDGLDRYGASVFGIDYHFSPIAMQLTPGWGLTLQDDAALRIGYGLLFTNRREYPDGQSVERESMSSWLVNLDYTLMGGVRFNYLSLFAGARAGWVWLRHGHTHTGGIHLEPAARLALRVSGASQIILQVYGGASLVPGLARREGLHLSIPLGARGASSHLMLIWERGRFEGTRLTSDQETGVPGGKMLMDTFGIAFGIRG